MRFYIVQSADGSFWGEAGWMDVARDACAFNYTAALLASHRHLGSRVIEVKNFHSDYRHEDILADPIFRSNVAD